MTQCPQKTSYCQWRTRRGIPPLFSYTGLSWQSTLLVLPYPGCPVDTSPHQLPPGNQNRKGCGQSHVAYQYTEKQEVSVGSRISLLKRLCPMWHEINVTQALHQWSARFDGYSIAVLYLEHKTTQERLYTMWLSHYMHTSNLFSVWILNCWVIFVYKVVLNQLYCQGEERGSGERERKGGVNAGMSLTYTLYLRGN